MAGRHDPFDKFVLTFLQPYILRATSQANSILLPLQNGGETFDWFS
jgi:hypothetical protein